MMKSFRACLLVFFAAMVISGCEEPKDNSLATDGVSADELAQYEADLAAVTGAEDNEDDGGDAPE